MALPEKPEEKGPIPHHQPRPVQKTVPEEIAQSCMDSQGYVIFVGVITPRRDAQKRNIIDWRYHRRNFSLEDARDGTKKFYEEFLRDFNGDLGPETTTGGAAA